MSDTPYMDAVREIARTRITHEQFFDMMRRGATAAAAMQALADVWPLVVAMRDTKKQRRRIRMARKRRRGWA